MKNYIVPEFEIVSFESLDIITVSIAVSSGQNETGVPDNWWE